MTIVPEDTAAVVAVETPPEPKPVVVVKAKRAHAPVELKVAAVRPPALSPGSSRGCWSRSSPRGITASPRPWPRSCPPP